MSCLKEGVLKALQAIVTEYAEGRGPLVKFKKQNEALVSYAKQNPKAFRNLGPHLIY